MMHEARNLQISQLLCELIPNLSVGCADFQITCRLLANKMTVNKHNIWMIITIIVKSTSDWHATTIRNNPEFYQKSIYVNLTLSKLVE